MALKQGSSRDVIAANIAALIESGLSPQQAVASAYEKACDGSETARTVDQNGWLEIKKNPISKVGVFPYSGRSIGAPDPNKMYMVYRPAEELGAPEAVESFRLIPWVDEHEMLGNAPGLTPADLKGVQGVVAEATFENGVLYGDLKAFGRDILGKIEDGKLELSCGYHCKWDFTPGVYEGQPYDAVQREIRGNHLALVKAGRCGPDVAVMDGFAMDTMEVVAMDPEKTEKTEKTAPSDGAAPPDGEKVADAEPGAETGASLEDLAEQVAALTKGLGDVVAFMTKLKPLEEQEHGSLDKAAKDEEKPAMDAAELTALKKEVAALKTGAFKAVMSEVSKRDALAQKMRPIVGAFDHAEMTLQEVAAYGVKKLKLPAKAGHEVTAMESYLHAKTPPVAQAAAMDAAPTADFVTAYLQGKK